MKKAPLVLSFLLIFSLFSFISATRASASNKIRVGVFYYPWYDCKGFHCNGYPIDYNISQPDTWWRVIDEPVLGNTSNSTYCMYASDNVTVIKQHLDWFKYAGVDFGIVSWWGNNSFEDNHTDILFNVTSSYAPWFRWVILIEPCYNVSSQGPDVLDQLRQYVYDHYAKEYRNIWLNDTSTGKPFLFWTYVDDFNPDTVRSRATNSTFFETRLLGQFLPGQNDRENNIDWYTWSLFWGSNNSSPFPPKNGSMCVMPRYDETRLDPENITGHSGMMNRTICCDPCLNGSSNGNEVSLGGEPLYDKQWKEVISNASAGKLNCVLIGTWNDFTERTQIEPCYDNTSAYRNDPFFLLNRTEYWINQLPVIDEFQPLLALPLFMLATLAAVIIYKRTRIHSAERQNLAG